jgi:hypothetical protein
VQVSEAVLNPKVRVERLLEELEEVVSSLDAETALEARGGLLRLAEAIVGRAIREALEASRRPAVPVRLTLDEAA